MVLGGGREQQTFSPMPKQEKKKKKRQRHSQGRDLAYRSQSCERLFL